MNEIMRCYLRPLAATVVMGLGSNGYTEPVDAQPPDAGIEKEESIAIVTKVLCRSKKEAIESKKSTSNINQTN